MIWVNRKTSAALFDIFFTLNRIEGRMESKMSKLLDEVRETRTVVEALAKDRQILSDALKKAQAALAEQGQEVAEVNEAIGYLDEIQADGNKALTDNTGQPPFTPSTQE